MKERKMHYSNISAAADALADFTIAADDVPAFRSAVDTLVRFVTEKRASAPILQHIAIYAAPDGLMVEGTDLDLFAAARVPAVVDAPGTLTLNPSALRNALRKAPKGHAVRITTDGLRATLRSGQTALNLNALPADDWPSLKPRDFANTLSWESDAETLSGELARLAPFMSTEETRFYLRGIYAHRAAGKRTLAATNGHVAAVIDRDDAGDDDKGGIIPAKTIALIQALAKEGERFALKLDDARIEFIAGRWSVRAKMIDGTFPDYARVFPSASGNVLTVDSRELLDHAANAIKAASQSKKSGDCRAMVIELAPDGCRAGLSRGSISPYARPLSGEYRGEPLSVGWNPAYLKALASPTARLAIDVPGAEGASLVTDPDAPHFRAAIMPMRNPGLPDPDRVTYPDIKAAPGRAADLFGVESFRLCGGTKADKPRKATPAECQAYLVDYAERCGLPIMVKRDLVERGDDAVGLTFGLIREAWTERHKVTDKWGRERDDFSREPIAHHPAQYADGAYSIPMPGRNQAPVTLETMGEDGQWSAPVVCSDAAGNIMLPDAPKVRKARKAKSAPVERKEASSAPDAAATPEIAPQPPVSGEIDPIEALSARLDAAEAAIAERPRIRIKAVAVLEAPSVENVTIGPWPGARRRLAERDQADAARAALVRARRERIVRAYLALRAQRAALRREVEQLQAKRARAVVNARRHRDMRLVARGQYQRAEAHADREHDKRARAVMLARSLQKRLGAEYRLIDRANDRRHAAEKALDDYRASAAAQYERACAERDTAKRLLSDAREQLAAVTRERDGQANAIAALTARIERIEAAGERLAA
jgi:DNA polymerase-3 subunit beta